MLEDLHTKRSLPQRLGLGEEPGKAATYLRALLAFAKETPGVGWAFKGTAEALKELADEQDDRVLERRFAELLDAGRQTREQVELVAELAKMVFVQQTAVLERLKAAGLLAAPAQVDALAKEAALAAYRGRIARDYQYADHRGIHTGQKSPHVSSLPCDEVYVVPRLLAERERLPLDARVREILRSLERLEELDADERVRLELEHAELAGEPWRRGLKRESEGVPLGQALGPERHAVIIGSPGVGKSALSRFLARAFALGGAEMEARLGWSEELLPLVVPLAGFAEARRARPDITLREHVDALMRERGGGALEEAAAEVLSAGGAMVILDGVDEVPEAGARLAVVRAVDQFIASHGPNRLVVTSRPYGYVRVAGEIPHFQLPNFSPAQVDDFVHRWQRSAERRMHPEAPDLAKAQAEADALLEEIRSNPRVAELTTNPLMLVLVSLIRYEQMRLPQERVQLYKLAVDALMGSWNQARSLLGREVGGTALRVEHLVLVWGAVAEWTRRTRNTGVFHRAELRRELVRVLEEMELDDTDPEATAESYLRAAADRAGLLEERTTGIFAFWHPTFEEFLAASRLTNPVSGAVESVLRVCDDPRWREVVLLAVGNVGVVKMEDLAAGEIVRAIAEDSLPPDEDLLHRRLLLAAACVADDAGVRRSQQESILLRLAEVVRRQPYDEFVQAFAGTVRALPALRLSAEGISTLAPLAHHPRWEIRMEAARLFANVSATNEEARALCSTLIGDVDADVRCHAALGLLRAGDGRPELVRHVLQSYDGRSSHVKPQALAYFRSTPEVVRTQVEALFASAHYALAAKAAHLLVQVSSTDERVLSALKEGLGADDPMLRREAARLLVQMGATDEGVLSALKEWLGADDPRLRLEAARLLEQVGATDERVLFALKEGLGADEPMLRLEAARLLEQVGATDERVLSALKEWLGADDPMLRREAALLLSEFDRGDETLVEHLAKVATPQQPWSALAACHRLLSGHPLSAEDWRELARVTSVAEGDTAKQLYAREMLFDWVQQKLRKEARVG